MMSPSLPSSHFAGGSTHELWAASPQLPHLMVDGLWESPSIPTLAINSTFAVPSSRSLSFLANHFTPAAHRTSQRQPYVQHPYPSQNVNILNQKTPSPNAQQKHKNNAQSAAHNTLNVNLAAPASSTSKPSASPRTIKEKQAAANNSMLATDIYMEHHLTENVDDPDNRFDFVLLPGAMNARRGMKIASPENIPCKYGNACFRKDCRFSHAGALFLGPSLPCQAGSPSGSPTSKGRSPARRASPTSHLASPRSVHQSYSNPNSPPPMYAQPVLYPMTTLIQ